MKTKVIILILAVILTAFQACTTKISEPVKDIVYTLPYLDGISVDGNPDDWEDLGLIISLSSDMAGEILGKDCNASTRLAYNDDGILFLAEVEDEVLAGSQAENWHGDGFEIFISAEKGSRRMVQYLISAGLAGNPAVPAADKFDYRTNTPESNSADLQMATVPDTDSYTMEILIPFEKLGIVDRNTDIFAMSFYVNDLDEGSTRENKIPWHYNDDTWANRGAMNLVRLGEKGKSSPQPTETRAFLRDYSEYHFIVFTDKNRSGHKVIISDGTKLYTKGKFELSGEQSVYHAVIDSSELSPDSPSIGIFTDGEMISFIEPGLVPGIYINAVPPNKFEKSIKDFEEEDKENFPPSGATLFVGSSSIRLWKSLGEDFDEIDVINRGFGGSTSKDVLYFYDRIITPYKPAVIVYFEGSNDLGEGMSPEEVCNNVEEFVRKVKEDLPDTKIIIMSVKVSIARKKGIDRVLETNRLIEKMVAEYPGVKYVDVHSCMMDSNGVPKSHIFGPDSLHMSRAGYELWIKELKPVLYSIRD